jgi:hypothetical protein
MPEESSKVDRVSDHRNNIMVMSRFNFHVRSAQMSSYLLPILLHLEARELKKLY